MHVDILAFTFYSMFSYRYVYGVTTSSHVFRPHKLVCWVHKLVADQGDRDRVVTLFNKYIISSITVNIKNDRNASKVNELCVLLNYNTLLQGFQSGLTRIVLWLTHLPRYVVRLVAILHSYSVLYLYPYPILRRLWRITSRTIKEMLEHPACRLFP